MILLTYRVKGIGFRLRLLDGLYRAVLYKDAHWHYFLDLEGITLRFSRSFEKRVRRWLMSNHYKFTRRLLYDPTRHEYPGLGFLGEDLANLFHDMSVLVTKYPSQVSLFPTAERLNHGLVNMAGIHDFREEAQIYLDLAYRRAELGRFILPLPEWLYVFLIKMFGKRGK